MSNEISELLIIGLIGVVLIIFGNYKRTQRTRLIASGIRTEGTVLSIEKSFHDQMTTFFPVISYTTLQNETIIKEHRIGVSNKRFKPGDSVNVIYDAENNNEFIIDDAPTRLLGPILMMAGFLLIAVSLLKYFFPLILK